MLKDGEKGVILQRDKKTYAIIPHTPCGLTTSDQLRQIADVADKHSVDVIKVTSAQRLALIGLEEEQIDSVWEDLGMEPGAGTGHVIRSIKVCPGTDACKRGLQDSLKVGKHLDEKFHGMETPGKMKFGVSACLFDCSECCIKDIGMIGTKAGWRVVVGGNGGSSPRLSRMVADKVTEEEALELIDQIMAYFEANFVGKQRLGAVINKRGWEHFMEGIGMLEAVGA